MNGLAIRIERFLATIERTPLRTLVLVMVALHVALSLWQSWFIQINDDGTLYIRAARMFVQGEFVQGRTVFAWFGFPLVIAAISKITTLDALTAGKILNFLASTGTFLLLLRMSWMQKPSKTTLVAVAVLIFGNYWWNEQRGAIIRDQLFFLLVIVSFFYLLRDSQRPQIINKVAFALACGCASLFRIEAAALIIMVPALLIALGPHSRPVRTIAMTVWLAMVIVIVANVSFRTEATTFLGLFVGPIGRIETLRDQVLAPYASQKALLAYSWIIGGLIVSGLLSALSPVSVGLTAWSAIRCEAFRKQYFLRLWLCYCAATVVALSAHAYFFMVVEPRYSLAPGLLLTIPAAVSATTLISSKSLQDRPAIVIVSLIVVWLGYGLFSSIKFYDVSRFHYAAGEWLRQNVPQGARSLSNNNQIAFYGELSAEDADGDFFKRSVGGREDISKLRNWDSYDVVVIRLRKAQLDQVPALDSAIGRPPSKEFENSRGDKILIYQPRKSVP